MHTTEQQKAMAQLAARLAEWDEHGEGKFSATDFAVAARAVLVAFAAEMTTRPNQHQALFQVRFFSSGGAQVASWQGLAYGSEDARGHARRAFPEYECYRSTTFLLDANGWPTEAA